MLVGSLIAIGNGTAYFRWLAPIVDNGSRIDAFELARRPVTDHLGYLIALGLTFVLVILLRQRVVEKWPILVLGLVVGVSAVLFFGVRQVPNGDSPSFEEVRSYVLDAETHQTCSSDLGWLRVCMYRGYGGWVPRFESMLESVVDGVDLDGRVLTVRQRPFRLPEGDYPAAFEAEIMGLLSAADWGDELTVSFRSSSSAGQRAGLRAAVGMWAVGLPVSPGISVTQMQMASSTGPYCNASDQGRTLVGMWLASRGDRAVIEEWDEILGRAASAPGAYRLNAGGAHVGNLVTAPRPRTARGVRGRFASPPETVNPGAPNTHDYQTRSAANTPPARTWQIPDTRIEPQNKNNPPPGEPERRLLSSHQQVPPCQ